MSLLLLLSALVLPPRESAIPIIRIPVAERLSVRADTDSVVTAGILTDLAAAFEEVARRNGYDRSAAPQGWLEVPYLASASTRPDVAEFFTHRAAYAADMTAHIDSIALMVVQRRLEAAGYQALQKKGMRDAFMVGFHKNGAKQAALLTAMRRQATVALKLHEFLVKIDPHVAVDEKTNTLLFDRAADKRRYDELAIAIDAVNDQLAKALGQGQTAASNQR